MSPPPGGVFGWEGSPVIKGTATTPARRPPGGASLPEPDQKPKRPRKPKAAAVPAPAVPAIDGLSPGDAAIVAGIASAEPLPPIVVTEKRRPPEEPPPGDPTPGAWTEPECPVVPLGHADGTFWFLSPSGQVRGISDAKLNANGIRGLFEHRHDWLWAEFPRYGKDGKTRVGWGASEVQEWLIRGCASKGLFSADRSLRGEGAWRDDKSGGLVVHCGDAVLVDGAWEPPGRYGRWVYPARPPQPRPGLAPLSDAEAFELLSLLGTWNWKRPEIDPALMLGWVGCAIVCGALQWRPHVWLVGDKSGGKSWLHELLRNLLGDALESYANSSAAGIRDALEGAARPVALDELEAEETNDKANAIVELARIASQMGGGKGVRGSPGGGARYFAIHSTFIFSSILQPPLLPQDISRITQLDLEPLEATPAQSAAVLKRIRAAAKLGDKLRRRVLDGWARWEATLEAFSSALAEAGHENRSASQFGTLLAMFDLITGNGPPAAERVAELVAQLDARALLGQSDEMPDHLRCLHHLLTSDLDVYRHGERRVLGEEVRLVADYMTLNQETTAAGGHAHQRLRNSGFAVVVLDDKAYLAVSNTHTGVGRLFAGSHWGGRSGRRPGWLQSLKRIEGVIPSPNNVKFGGLASRALLIPFAAMDIEPPGVSQPRKRDHDGF